MATLPTEGDVIVLQVTETTTAEEREALAKLGFIRVDGLPVLRERLDPITGLVRETAYIIGREPQAGGYLPGSFEIGRDFFVIVTHGGEIWLALYKTRVEFRAKKLLQLLDIAHNDQLRIPCSGRGHVLDWRALMKRVVDPDWQFCPPKRPESATRQPRRA